MVKAEGGSYMRNLADEIENFILRKLAGETNDITILQRNELADELSCAPSQISYVLSTRFTVDRGFLVQSRRGSGGFVRIVRVPVRKIVYNQIDNELNYCSPEEIEKIIVQLNREGIITSREAGLISYFLQVIDDYVNPGEKMNIFRSLLITLKNNS